MRPDDFFEDNADELFVGIPGRPRLDRDLIAEIRRGPIEDIDDVEVAVALARLVHDELEAFGTGGGEQLDDGEMRDALIALRAVTDRVGIDGLEIPFRDLTSFRTFWIREGARGSWQGRRDLLSDIFEAFHNRLIELESRALTSSLADPVSPRGRTGWARSTRRSRSSGDIFKGRAQLRTIGTSGTTA